MHANPYCHAYGNSYAYTDVFHAHGNSYAYTDVFSLIGHGTVQSICELRDCNFPPGLTLRQPCSPVFQLRTEWSPGDVIASKN